MGYEAVISVLCITIVNFGLDFTGKLLEILQISLDDNKDVKISFGKSCR